MHERNIRYVNVGTWADATHGMCELRGPLLIDTQDETTIRVADPHTCEECGGTVQYQTYSKTHMRPVSQYTVAGNLFDLPDQCYAVLPGTQKVIAIKFGEKGYYDLSKNGGYEGVPGDLDAHDYAMKCNDELRVTEAEMEAMLAGSMWGWSYPGLNPLLYADTRSHVVGEWQRTTVKTSLPVDPRLSMVY